MARELILRLKPPCAGGAHHLLQQLGTAVAGLGEGGKQAMTGMKTRVNVVGGRDAILTLIPDADVSDDQVNAVAQIAASFAGPFRVEAEIGEVVVAPPSAVRSAPAPVAAPADADLPTLDADEPDEGGVPDEGGSVPPYADWNVPDLRAECGHRELKKSGNKDELVARLEEDDAAEDDGDDEAAGDE